VVYIRRCEDMGDRERRRAAMGRSRVVGVPQEDFQLRYKDAKSDFASYAFLSDALTGSK